MGESLRGVIVDIVNEASDEFPAGFITLPLMGWVRTIPIIGSACSKQSYQLQLFLLIRLIEF